jgi:DNA primase
MILSFKDQLKEKANIADVISRFTPLIKKPSGGYISLCPFHQDEHPSLHIYEKTFSCFTCRAGSKEHPYVKSSDVYGFLKGVLKTDFDGALKWLASYLNVPFPSKNESAQKESTAYQKWIEKCQEAKERFTGNLILNDNAFSYVFSRGFDASDIETWGIGFGDQKDPDFSNTKDRIVFTLFDYYGKPVSFTGRTLLSPDDLKKTNEQRKQNDLLPIVKYQDRFPVKKTDPSFEQHPFPVFHKNRFLHGIHLAKHKIYETGIAILVEGWTDVIKLHKAGAQNAVGTMGVMLSEDQLALLKQAGAKKVIIMRDGDPAGEKTIDRDAMILQKHGIVPLVFPLYDRMDPDDFASLCLTENKDAFEQIFADCKTYLQHQIDKVYFDYFEKKNELQRKLSSVLSRSIDRVVSVLSSIEDPIEREIYTAQCASLFDFGYDILKQNLFTKEESNLLNKEKENENDLQEDRFVQSF